MNLLHEESHEILMGQRTTPVKPKPELIAGADTILETSQTQNITVFKDLYPRIEVIALMDTAISPALTSAHRVAGSML